MTPLTTNLTGLTFLKNDDRIKGYHDPLLTVPNTYYNSIKRSQKYDFHYIIRHPKKPLSLVPDC